MGLIRFVLASALLAAVGASAQQCSMQCLLQMSEGSDNPCGCNFIKKTSRNDLRTMTLPELRKGLGQLSTDMVDLEKQMEETDKTQKNSEQKQKDAIKKLESDDDEQKKTIAKATAEMNTKRSEVNLENDAGLEKIEDSNDEIGKVREEWKEVHNQLLGKTMMVMECGCGAPAPAKPAAKKAVKLAVADSKSTVAKIDAKPAKVISKKKSLLSSHRQLAVQPSAADEEKQMKLILQYEKLESQLYIKKKKLTQMITEHGARERKLDVQKQSLEIKIRNNEADQEQSKAINKRQQNMIDDASKTLSSYVKTKQAEVERKTKDLEDARKQIKDLDAKMASCKCPALF